MTKIRKGMNTDMATAFEKIKRLLGVMRIIDPKTYQQKKDEITETIAEGKAAIAKARELIEANPLNKDPEKLEADIKRAIYEVRYAQSETITGSALTDEETQERVLGKLSDMGYDVSTALKKGENQGDLMAHSVATELLSMYIGLLETSLGLKERAETAEEFKIKYGNKRLTATNAIQARLLNYIYVGYQINDGIPKANRDRLFETTSIQTKLNIIKDGYRYLSYVRLAEWTADAFQSAINMRNALRSASAHMHQIASTVLCGEHLRKNLGDTADDVKVWAWLHNLTLEGYTPQDEDYYLVIAIRKNIAQGLHYMDAYNTLIEMIAAEIKVPEYTIYKVDMESVTALIGAINEALDAVRQADKTYLTDRFKPEFVDELMLAFEDVPKEPEPIQPEAIAEVKTGIRSAIKSGAYIWTSLLSTLKDGI